jgi:hypothetical protein
MASFVDLLRSLPGNGRMHVKCLYAPGPNEAVWFPGRVVSGRITLQMSVGEYENFEDWLQNDDDNRLSPMKIRWSNGNMSLEVDLDDEVIRVRSTNNQVLNSCREYAERAHMTFRTQGE